MVGRGIDCFLLFLLNLIFKLKSLNLFMGREDPIEFIYIIYLFCLIFIFKYLIYFVGVMGRFN